MKENALKVYISIIVKHEIPSSETTRGNMTKCLFACDETKYYSLQKKYMKTYNKVISTLPRKNFDLFMDDFLHVFI